MSLMTILNNRELYGPLIVIAAGAIICFLSKVFGREIL